MDDNEHMHQSLRWGSSEVDWCEANYEITHNIAEFYNTVSNILFLVFPPLLIYLFRQYAQHVTWGINLVWGMLAFIGLGSVYFHCTLSLIGQLVDEIAIIWYFYLNFALWFPRRIMPEFFQQDRNMFMRYMLLMSVLSTGLACVMPAINCMVLMVIVIPALGTLYYELQGTTCVRARRLGFRCFVQAVIALLSWLSDKLFCNMWVDIGFPYMHCFWHIFIALSAYQGCVLFAYFNAIAETPEMKPNLLYWPHDGLGAFGIPYVILQTKNKETNKDAMKVL